MTLNNKIIIDNKGFRLYGLNKTRRDLFTNFVSFGEGVCDFPITMKRNVGIVATIFLKSQEPDNFYLLNVSCKMHVKILFKANDLKEDELYFCEGQYFRRKNDGKNLEFYEVANSEIKTINTVNEKKFDWKKKVVWRLLGNYEEFIKSLDADDKTGMVFAKAYRLQEGDVISMNDFVFKFGENTEDLDKEKRVESEKQQKKPDENKLTDSFQTPAILESIVLGSLLDKNDSKNEKNSIDNTTDLRSLENNNENLENRTHLENLPNKPEKIGLANPERHEKYKDDGLLKDAKVNECREKVVETLSSLDLAPPKEKLNDQNPEMALVVSNSKQNFELNEKKIEEVPPIYNPEVLQNLVTNSNENFELNEKIIEEAPQNQNIEDLNNQPDSNKIDEPELPDKTSNDEKMLEKQIEHPDEYPDDGKMVEEQYEKSFQSIDETEPEPDFTEIPIKITNYELNPPLNLIHEIEHKSNYYNIL